MWTGIEEVTDAGRNDGRQEHRRSRSSDSPRDGVARDTGVSAWPQDRGSIQTCGLRPSPPLDGADSGQPLETDTEVSRLLCAGRAFQAVRREQSGVLVLI